MKLAFAVTLHKILQILWWDRCDSLTAKQVSIVNYKTWNRTMVVYLALGLFWKCQCFPSLKNFKTKRTDFIYSTATVPKTQLQILHSPALAQFHPLFFTSALQRYILIYSIFTGLAGHKSQLSTSKN